MFSRRNFVKIGAIGGAGMLLAPRCAMATPNEAVITSLDDFKIVSTWNHGLAANQAAVAVLLNGGSILDAVEKGVMITESDPENKSVGLGGLPDREGKVTLDACIMTGDGACGAVAFLEEIENPIAVARLIMENTPHVMLVGKGAQAFALANGFDKVNLLTESSKKDWENWLKASEYKPKINSENHDTIGMLGIDKHGNLAGSCTTSGMAYKINGRVGDSPIIGAGLFVDNEVGAACATGVGEAVIRVAGSAMVVELMRNGASPEEACHEVVMRIMKKHKNLENIQVGFLALNNRGDHGAYSVYAGFNFAVAQSEHNAMQDAKYKLEW